MMLEMIPEMMMLEVIPELMREMIPSDRYVHDDGVSWMMVILMYL